MNPYAEYTKQILMSSHGIETKQAQENLADLNEKQLTQVQMLKNELENSNKRNERLKQVVRTNKAFKDKIHEFRELVCCILGYKIDLIDQYANLLSIYAFSPDDLISFKLDPNGMVLMETTFVSDVQNGVGKEVEIYYKRGRSVPAMLAAVTIGLWERSTIQVT